MAYTVKELRLRLSTLPSDALVILSSDEEGNRYSHLADVEDHGMYVANGARSGEVYYSSESADDMEVSEDEWETMINETPKCVVLYPIA